MCALVFCKDLSYITNIDLPWEDLVFLSFRLHTASVQHFQNKPAISFDSSPPPNCLFFQHVRNSHIQPPEARSLPVLEVRAFLHGTLPTAAPQPLFAAPGWCWRVPAKKRAPRAVIVGVRAGCQLQRSRFGHGRQRWDRGRWWSWVQSDKERGSRLWGVRLFLLGRTKNGCVMRAWRRGNLSNPSTNSPRAWEYRGWGPPHPDIHGTAITATANIKALLRCRYSCIVIEVVECLSVGSYFNFPGNFLIAVLKAHFWS